MKVTIIETNENETLEIIDPSSGMDWTDDLLGNHGALPEYDDETDTYNMHQEDYKWWSDLIDRYQKADDRYHELLRDLSQEEAEALETAAQNLGCDLENYPEYLQEVCDEAEGK